VDVNEDGAVNTSDDLADVCCRWLCRQAGQVDIIDGLVSATTWRTSCCHWRWRTDQVDIVNGWVDVDERQGRWRR
jgi:hypothetical protein